MKNRRVAVIISLSVALIALLATLPAQAIGSTDIDFKFERVYTTSAGDEYLEFSWKTQNDETKGKIQYKGGGQTNVWTSLSLVEYWLYEGRSIIWTNRVIPAFPQTSAVFKFRLSLKICLIYSTQEGCTLHNWTDWQEIEQTISA